MKTFKMILAMFLFGMIVIACGDDDGNDGNVDCNSSFSIEQELSAETAALTDAATVYGMNPTTENCNAFKAAYQDYLDAAVVLEECANQVGQGAEYQASLQAAQDLIASIPC